MPSYLILAGLIELMDPCLFLKVLMWSEMQAGSFRTRAQAIDLVSYDGNPFAEYILRDIQPPLFSCMYLCNHSPMDRI